jgi:hypothetical protein
MCKRLDCAPDPHIEWLLSVAVDILEEFERGLAFGTFFDLRLRFLIMHYKTRLALEGR